MKRVSYRGLLERLTIRMAGRDDLPALEWDGEYTHFRQLYREIYQCAERGEAILWVAEFPEAGIIGQLFVQLRSVRPELADGFNRAYLYGFRVRQDYRNLGVGSALLAFVEADLSARGFCQTCLNVSRDNVDARRLYERFGYRIVAAEAGDWSYLDEQGIRHQVHEPAWRMQKELNLSPERVKNSLDYSYPIR